MASHLYLHGSRFHFPNEPDESRFALPKHVHISSGQQHPINILLCIPSFNSWISQRACRNTLILPARNHIHVYIMYAHFLLYLCCYGTFNNALLYLFYLLFFPGVILLILIFPTLGGGS